MNVSEAEELLNVLLTRNYDAEKGFERAEKEVQNPNIKGFFRKNYKKRYQFGHEIKEMVENLGGKPNRGSSLVGDAHRMWMNIKETFAKNSESAVIKECLRGEKIIIKDYKKALKSPAIRKDYREKLQDQLDFIKASKEEMEGMRMVMAR